MEKITYIYLEKYLLAEIDKHCSALCVCCVWYTVRKVNDKLYTGVCDVECAAHRSRLVLNALVSKVTCDATLYIPNAICTTHACIFCCEFEIQIPQLNWCICIHSLLAHGKCSIHPFSLCLPHFMIVYVCLTLGFHL